MILENDWSLTCSTTLKEYNSSRRHWAIICEYPILQRFSLIPHRPHFAQVFTLLYSIAIRNYEARHVKNRQYIPPYVIPSEENVQPPSPADFCEAHNVILSQTRLVPIAFGASKHGTHTFGTPDLIGAYLEGANSFANQTNLANNL